MSAAQRRRGANAVTEQTVTEAAWQQQVIALAHTLGWRTMHVRQSVVRVGQWATTTSVAGWPDLVLWHPTQRRAAFVELKTNAGRVTSEQRAVLTGLRCSGLTVDVWRPRDLDAVRQWLQGRLHSPIDPSFFRAQVTR